MFLGGTKNLLMLPWEDMNNKVNSSNVTLDNFSFITNFLYLTNNLLFQWLQKFYLLRISCSSSNLFGILSEPMKNEYHPRLKFPIHVRTHHSSPAELVANWRGQSSWQGWRQDFPDPGANVPYRGANPEWPRPRLFYNFLIRSLKTYFSQE